MEALDAAGAWLGEPLGRGRPGWHLECSAMIRAHLGEAIDIHGGGPRSHLSSPRKRTRAKLLRLWRDFVRYWMHNAYVDMDGEKMSKSLGNVRTVRELGERYPGEVLRFALLSAHYRSPLNFSVAVLERAQDALDAFYGAFRRHAAIVLPTSSRSSTRSMALAG